MTNHLFALLTVCLCLLSLPSASRAEEESYDEEGRVIKSTDSAGITTYYAYDAAGNRVEVRTRAEEEPRPREAREDEKTRSRK